MRRSIKKLLVLRRIANKFIQKVLKALKTSISSFLLSMGRFMRFLAKVASRGNESAFVFLQDFSPVEGVDKGKLPNAINF